MLQLNSKNNEYLDKFVKNVNFILKNKPQSFKNKHLDKFTEVEQSLKEHLYQLPPTASNTDRTVVYTTHMAKFRRIARSIGLMRARSPHRHRR